MSNKKNVETTTHCHDCIFCEYTGVKQTGCQLGRLDKFDNKEREVIDGFDAYKINRICMACRDENWAEGKDKPIDDVYEEMCVSVDFVIVDNGGLMNPLQRLEASLISAKNQTIKPNSIIVVVPEGFKLVKECLDKIESFLDGTAIKYQLVHHLEKDAVYERLLDVGVLKCRGVYYSGYKMGEVIPADFVQKLDHFHNRQLKRYIMVTPYDIYHQVVFRAYHKLLGGNDGGYIEDKIGSKAQEQETLDFIHSWEDVCKIHHS